MWRVRVFVLNSLVREQDVCLFSVSLSCVAVLCLPLRVLMSWLGHQVVWLGPTLDDPWFDSAGAVADFVGGNLQKTVAAQCLADGWFRREQPLRQERIAGNGKAHPAGPLVMHEGRLRADHPDHVIGQQCCPQLTANHIRRLASEMVEVE